MKLRIKDNTLRLRLQQQEVRHLADTGRVRAAMGIPLPRMQTFTYEISTHEEDSWEVAFVDMKLLVRIPASICHKWATSDRVSLSKDIALGNEEVLHLLIEKDFACLQPRQGEDDSDAFPNPTANG